MISWRVRPSLPWCFGVAEGCFQHRIQYNGKSWEKATFYRVSEGMLESFFFVVCPSFPAMVFWCGGGLFSAPDSLTGTGWEMFF